jgi:hypothetical protein
VAQDLLSLVLLLLAVFGFLALLRRLGGSLLRLGLHAAEGTAAAGLAEVHERRGDVTAFMERRASAQSLRRARRLTTAAAAGYFLLLAIPLFGGVAREVWAACSLLWFLPGRPLRTSLSVTPPEER